MGDEWDINNCGDMNTKPDLSKDIKGTVNSHQQSNFQKFRDRFNSLGPSAFTPWFNNIINKGTQNIPLHIVHIYIYILIY